jgi:hypothetical protein
MRKRRDVHKKDVVFKAPLSRLNGSGAAVAGPPAVRSTYATISHTLPLDVVEHLRAFSHYQRVSASSVIEFALVNFFKSRDDAELGTLLRRKGAGPRRKPKST